MRDGLAQNAWPTTISVSKFDDLDLSNANALFGEAAEIFVANPKIVDEAMRA